MTTTTYCIARADRQADPRFYPTMCGRTRPLSQTVGALPSYGVQVCQDCVQADREELERTRSAYADWTPDAEQVAFLTSLED